MKRDYMRKTALLIAGAFLWNLPAGSCAALSLDEAVQMALQQNTAVRITALGEDVAAATLKQAKGNKGFSVTANTSLSTSDKNNEGRVNANNNGITASLPIYSGGKNEANVESGELGVKMARLNTDREKENIKLNVIQSYYNVLEAQQTIHVDQSSVDNYQAHLTNVEQLFSAGSKARIDVLRSSVELSNARQKLIKAQNSYEVDLSKLRNILNMDPNEPLTLTDDFSYVVFPQELAGCVAYARQNRKDLQADQYTLQQKELAVKAAKAGLLPTVNLSVGASWEKQGLPSSDNHNYTAGVTASWDIFDGGTNKAKIAAAKTAADVARLTLEQDQNSVDLAVREAYYNMREAEKRFTSTQDAVKQAKEDYFIASEKYRAGEGLMLDIIDAQLALSTAQLNYISAQYDYARYKAGVENAMGTGIPAAAAKVAAGTTQAATAATAGSAAGSAQADSDAAMTAAANGVTQ